MLYCIDKQVFDKYPGFSRAVIIARRIDNTFQSPALAELLAKCEEQAMNDRLEDFWNHPKLAVWAETFREMGLNPKKYPPSVLNLIKRVRSGKKLPYVNSLVAAFNCISLRHLCPCGGDDLSRVQGNLQLGFAVGDERYVPLGQPDMLEHPPAGEVIYMDTGTRDVFCRSWCWKNGDNSKLREETSSAVINIDGMLPTTKEDLLRATEDLCDMLREYTGAETQTYLLHSNNTHVTL